MTNQDLSSRAMGDSSANIKGASIPFNDFQYIKMVAQVSSADEFKAALGHDGLVVVDFFATWCGPCKVIAPILDKFAKEYTSAKFIKVDVDEVGEVAQQYEITAMPTILLFKNGEIVERVVGANPAGIKSALANHA